jgi:hypothetical protein
MLRSLEGQTDPATWTWLRGTRLLALMEDQAVVSVPSPANDDVAGRYVEAIRALLRERLAREVTVRVVVAAPSPELPPPVHPPPDWIDSATWARLDADLRAALAGSQLAPDGGLEVRAEAYELFCLASPSRCAPCSRWRGPELPRRRHGSQAHRRRQPLERRFGIYKNSP